MDFKKCPICGLMEDTVKRRLQNSNYHNDALNYIVCCIDCYVNIQEHWRNVWRDVHSPYAYIVEGPCQCVYPIKSQQPNWAKNGF